MNEAFGLDFAGYSGGKTALAHARQIAPDRVDITVYDGHIFAQKIPGSARLAQVVEAERGLLRACCARGPVMVDLPLELDDLPRPADPAFVWELVHRPVDYALDAMPPLANLIGAPVARFLNLLHELPAEWVGTRLFETYPAASLGRLGLHGRGYKSNSGVTMQFINGQWQGAALMAENATRLGWQADSELRLTDDEFDAALCALTGIADTEHQLRGERLDDEITRRIHDKSPETALQTFHAPRSFVLLEKLPPFRVRLHKQRLDNAQMLVDMPEN